jgi:hypothetical protein
MLLNPLQLLGALVAAGIVLVLARADAKSVAWQYSLRTLLIAITVASIAFGIVSTAARLGYFTPQNLAAIAMFTMLCLIAALTVILARWINRKCEAAELADAASHTDEPLWTRTSIKLSSSSV